MFALRGMGAGDVKLLATVGAWLGPAQVVVVALATSIAGGVLAIVVALLHGYLKTHLRTCGLLLTHWRVMGVRAAARGHARRNPRASTGLRGTGRNWNDGDVMAPIKVLRRWRSEDGAQLVEFALVLPLLLFVVLGIAEFGFIFQRYEVVTNAAREGARIAVLPGTIRHQPDAIRARVRAYIQASRVPVTGGTPPASIVAVDSPTARSRGWRPAPGQCQAVHGDLHAQLYISSSQWRHGSDLHTPRFR